MWCIWYCLKQFVCLYSIIRGPVKLIVIWSLSPSWMKCLMVDFWFGIFNDCIEWDRQVSLHWVPAAINVAITEFDHHGAQIWIIRWLCSNTCVLTHSVHNKNRTWLYYCISSLSGNVSLNSIYHSPTQHNVANNTKTKHVKHCSDFQLTKEIPQILHSWISHELSIMSTLGNLVIITGPLIDDIILDKNLPILHIS